MKGSRSAFAGEDQIIRLQRIKADALALKSRRQRKGAELGGIVQPPIALAERLLGTAN